MSMTTDEALDRFASIMSLAYFTRKRTDGVDKAESESDVDYEALSVLREALAEYDVSEKAWDIKQRQLEQMTAERDALKAEVGRLQFDLRVSRGAHKTTCELAVSLNQAYEREKARAEKAEAALKAALALQNPPPEPIVGDDERRKMLDYLQGLYAGAHADEELVDENIPVSEGGLLNCKFGWCARNYKKIRALILVPAPAKPKEKMKECEDCKGRGTKTIPIEYYPADGYKQRGWITCPGCHGTGQIIDDDDRSALSAPAPAKPKAAIDELSIVKTGWPNWHKVSFLISTKDPVTWVYSAFGVPRP